MMFGQLTFGQMKQCLLCQIVSDEEKKRFSNICQPTDLHNSLWRRWSKRSKNCCRRTRGWATTGMHRWARWKESGLSSVAPPGLCSSEDTDRSGTEMGGWIVTPAFEHLPVGGNGATMFIGMTLSKVTLSKERHSEKLKATLSKVTLSKATLGKATLGKATLGKATLSKVTHTFKRGQI